MLPIGETPGIFVEHRAPGGHAIRVEMHQRAIEGKVGHGRRIPPHQWTESLLLSLAQPLFLIETHLPDRAEQPEAALTVGDHRSGSSVGSRGRSVLEPQYPPDRVRWRPFLRAGRRPLRHPVSPIVGEQQGWSYEDGVVDRSDLIRDNRRGGLFIIVRAEGTSCVNLFL